MSLIRSTTPSWMNDLGRAVEDAVNEGVSAKEFKDACAYLWEDESRVKLRRDRKEWAKP